MRERENGEFLSLFFFQLLGGRGRERKLGWDGLARSVCVCEKCQERGREGGRGSVESGATVLFFSHATLDLNRAHKRGCFLPSVSSCNVLGSSSLLPHYMSIRRRRKRKKKKREGEGGKMFFLFSFAQRYCAISRLPNSEPRAGSLTTFHPLVSKFEIRLGFDLYISKM